MITKFIKKQITKLFLETEIVAPETTNLLGKTVIITGGSKGIGLAVAKILANENANVVILARSNIISVPNVEVINTDVTKASEVEHAVRNVLDKFGKVDVLINNAGLFLDKPLEDISEEEYDALMDTNLKGVFLVTKAVIPQMRKFGGGTIINIGSKISHNTQVAPNKVLYTTSKYAIEGFSLALSRELKASGIKVTCLMLGTVSTFVSLQSKKFLSPYNVGFVIGMILKSPEIDFESIIMKSVKQNI